MADVVKLDVDTMSKLEELQAMVEEQTGTTVTHRALLTWLIESAVESPSDLSSSFGDGTATLSEDEAEQFTQALFDSGVKTDEDDIDDILYE